MWMSIKVTVSIQRAVSFLPARINSEAAGAGALVLDAIGDRAMSVSVGNPAVVVIVRHRDGKNTELASANIHGSLRLILLAIFMKPADSSDRW
jgi:hypothetical protein